MFRRRMMLESHKNNDIDWDLEWDYTMGLPENNGFTKTISGNYTYDELTNEGLKIKISNAPSYLRYEPTGYETCSEGIYEIKLFITSVPVNVNVLNGIRLLLSDGVSGNQICINGNKIKYISGNGQIKIADMPYEEDFIIKIESIENKNYVYLNNKLIYQSSIDSTLFTIGNRLFFQENPLRALLKSIKFKKIS